MLKTQVMLVNKPTYINNNEVLLPRKRLMNMAFLDGNSKSLSSFLALNISCYYDIVQILSILFYRNKRS